MKTLKQQIDEAVDKVMETRGDPNNKKIRAFVKSLLTAGAFVTIDWTIDVAKEELSDEEMERQIKELEPK